MSNKGLPEKDSRRTRMRMSGMGSGTYAAASNCNGFEKIWASKKEVKELEEKLTEIVDARPAKQKDDIEKLLVGSLVPFSGVGTGNAGRGSQHKTRHSTKGLVLKLSSLKPKDSVGVLPVVEGVLYEGEAVRYCPNPSCKRKMSWYDITGFGFKKNANTEAYICSDVLCPYLPEKTPIRKVKLQQRECEALAADAASICKELSVAGPSSNSEGTKTALVCGNLLDRTVIGGAVEPDQEIVEKAMNQYYDMSKKKLTPMKLELNLDLFEEPAMNMMFGQDDGFDEM